MAGDSNTDTEDRSFVHPGVKAFLRFFMCGPRSAAGGLIWGLMFPITLPIWFVSQFVVGCLEVMVGMMTGNIVVVDGGGGGDGVFDEVSTRRRDDYQFITGTGKYAKEN